MKAGSDHMGEAALEAYLARIGLSNVPRPDAAGLAELQRAHRLAIAFENLDIALGRGISIDSGSVFAKLVGRRRGGYCFEQNRLFADMLATLGMATRPLLARVRLGLAPDETPPRTHVLLLAEVAGEEWVADAGFGMAGVPPLPLVDGASAADHRLRRIGEAGALGGAWLVEQADAGPQGGWQPLYSFDLAEVAAIDLEQANHWTSTRPGTRFTSQVIVSLLLPEGSASLTGSRLTLRGRDGTTASELADAVSWREALADVFGLELAIDEVERLGIF